jgi:hypothetical protein
MTPEFTPTLRYRLAAWAERSIDWRRADRLLLEFFSFLIAALAVYVLGLVAYCAAIIVAIAYGVWPL